MNSTKYFEVKLCSEYSSCVLWTYDALLKEKVLTSVLGKSKGESRDGAKLDRIWAAISYLIPYWFILEALPPRKPDSIGSRNKQITLGRRRCMYTGAYRETQKGVGEYWEKSTGLWNP